MPWQLASTSTIGTKVKQNFRFHLSHFVSHSFLLQNLEIYSNDGLELKDGEVLAKENGDAIADKVESEDKKAEKEKSKEEKAKKMDVDKKIQEVESASGEKVVRAAHVPVPSQVRFGLIKTEIFTLLC